MSVLTLYWCSSLRLNWGPSWFWSTLDIPSRFVVKKLTQCHPKLHMTRVNSLLELTDIRNKWKKESGNCISEIFKPKIFSKNLHLKLSWLLQFGFPKLCSKKFHNSSNLGLEQRLHKWSFIESSSSRLEHSFPKSYFIRSSNLGQVISYTL